ncbi:putative metabolite transport protein HI_1104 [Chrysoperla carnea]|uniref:putative metabolite transport protein HI_1104 n=1 Tax=Chrysoperla carnea TaxID=189513 RepID=UPI001D06BCCB|nr:putative metabolite transport protein HI_1104 [Chrysoperla carnea]
MISKLKAKLAFLYPPYILAVLCSVYILAELGHFLIGASSKATAIDLHYGDISCQLNTTAIEIKYLPVRCDKANNSETCLSLEYNGTKYCEWNYNGLGIDYQILAGPSYITVYTIAGVLIGMAADRFNRVRLLSVCTLVFTTATFLMGFVGHYWHFLILRMFLAAGESGCNPLATGIMTDIFSEEKRALVMSIFNWGIYGGYGMAFPIGRYVTELNIWDLGWRMCYIGAGFVGFIVTSLVALTLYEPTRTEIVKEENKSTKKSTENVTMWTVWTDPRMIFLCLAASIRHSGGMCFAYNCDLYYREYFPDYDLGWWLFMVTTIIGGIGVIFGGILSDKIVGKLGIRSRVVCLIVSQLIAFPPAIGSVAFEPFWAMVNLSISYFFAEMWFGILFAILVEIIPLQVRSTTIGLFLFVMNNIGGNLPIFVEPVSKAWGYREALYIFYAGAYLVSAILFFCMMLFMKPPKNEPTPEMKTSQSPVSYDNTTFSLQDEHPNGKISVNGNGLDMSKL